MANLRDVRLRMKAIRQTLQVTSAMNLISTAKLRKGRRVLQEIEPFFTRVQKSMLDVLPGADMEKSKFMISGEREENSRSAIVVVTSDKGLAGGYNMSVIRQVNQLCAELENPIIIVIGSVGYRYFIHSPWLVLENFSFRAKLPELDDAKQIADYIISQYQWGVFGEVHIVYTHMYSSVRIAPRERQLLPLSAGKLREEFSKGKLEELRFDYWPSKTEVFDTLVPLYIKGIIYGSLVESYVSEQSARMSAMDEASKSAQDMLSDLQLFYNRVRQAGITQEITEIVGGAETLGE